MVESTKGRKRSTNRRVYESEAKRPTITFRVRDELHAKLKASAEARGFSLSEEIEHRLNRSLDTAGDHFAELALQLIADNWRAIQSLSGRKMVEDRFTLQACCEAAYRATELLAGVNGLDLKVGLFDGLGPEGQSIEAGKQLGHAIVYHREMQAMKNPPAWAVDVYGRAMVDAMGKRVDALKAAAEAPSPTAQDVPPAEPRADHLPAQPSKPTPPAARPATPDEIAAMKPARGQLPPEIGDRALWDEITADRPDRDEPPLPPEPATPAPRRRTKAKAGA